MHDGAVQLPGRRAQAISPTAHYTAHVWARNGLGPSALSTLPGRALHGLVGSVTLPSKLLGGPTLDAFLLARHRIIDHLLTSAIDDGVTQVVELAAGLSPRGVAFTQSHPDLSYVEVDLPRMTEHKRAALARCGPLAAGHRLTSADVFADADALAAVAEGLDRSGGLVVITEGLLNYFPTSAVEQLWSRIAAMTASFARGTYLSDIHLATMSESALLQRGFVAALSAFVRGRVHLHYPSADAALAALTTAGFAAATLHAAADHAGELPGMAARGANLVRVIEAHTDATPA